MTAVPTDFDPPGDGWTTDDLDKLPEDGRRRELIDGVLIVSPSPTNVHQVIAGLLMGAFGESCPLDYEVTQGVEIRVNRRRSFIPDVLVTTAEAANRRDHKFQPHEVLLAVEVVSRWSQTMDRITKPALYAQADVPFYWRIESDDGIVVHTHRIDPEAEIYLPTGTFTETIETAEPWEISIPILRITPRFLRR